MRERIVRIQVRPDDIIDAISDSDLSLEDVVMLLVDAADAALDLAGLYVMRGQLNDLIQRREEEAGENAYDEEDWEACWWPENFR